MKQDSMFDRHFLRKKLRWWRLSTVMAVILGLIVLFVANSDRFILPDHIARLKITGVIQDDELLLELIEEQRTDETVKAVILEISSPGGTTYGGEQIYKAIKELSSEKPVVADIRTMATSAGYMVASAANYIVAGETSVVGSIGVIFQYPQISDLLDKIGISVEEIKSTPLKAAPSPFQPASDEAIKMINAMVIDSYQWFVDIVANNRNLDRATALNLADGRVFTGRQALAYGLIDNIGDEGTIRAYLADHQINDDMAIIDKRRDSLAKTNFLNNQIRNFILKNLGFSDVSIFAPPFTELIFLDGLVSFWHLTGSNHNK